MSGNGFVRLKRLTMKSMMNYQIQVVSNHYMYNHIVLESIKYMRGIVVLQVSVENLVELRREILIARA
jgi:hypothetical protein